MLWLYSNSSGIRNVMTVGISKGFAVGVSPERDLIRMLILNDSRVHLPRVEKCAPVITTSVEKDFISMWRRPVGRAGSGPANRGTFRAQASDYEPHSLPGCKVVDGRELSQEFIDGLKEMEMPPTVDFVEQMRERKRNAERSEGRSSPDRSEEAPDATDPSA